MKNLTFLSFLLLFVNIYSQEQKASVEDFVTEQGDVEHWKVNKKQINKKELEKITEYLDHLKSMLD